MEQHQIDFLTQIITKAVKEELYEEITQEVTETLNKKFEAKWEEHNDLQLIHSKSFINTFETAELLGLKPRTVRKLNEEGKLMGRKYKKTGYLFFERLEVLKFQKENLHYAASFQ